MRPLPTALIAALCLALLLCTQAAISQTNDLQHAQTHLDAARALIPADPAYTAASRYAEMVPLEVKANRPEMARELTFLIRGLMLEDDNKDNAARYTLLLAGAYLAQDKTEDALRVLESLGEPDSLSKQLYLQAIHQNVRRFGLQRGIDLAQKAFPSVMDRRSVYCKLCYTLAVKGEIKIAKEFIAVAMDLTEIYQKLDAYRYAAVGMHTVGDTQGAAAMLEEAVLQANAYDIATTKINMLVDLSATFTEIGNTDRSREMLVLAQAAIKDIKPDEFLREKAIRQVALGWAQLGERDTALQIIAMTQDPHHHTVVFKAIIKSDLLAGHIDRAEQLNNQHRIYIGDQLELQAALAKIKRGETASALTMYESMLNSFTPWQNEAGQAFATSGSHSALQALAPKIKNLQNRYQLHLGAAQGYLAD